MTHHLLAAENMFECSDDKNLRAGTDGTGDGTNAADCDKRVMTIKLPIRECGRCMHIPNALAPILLLPFLFVPAGAHIKILISGHYAEDLEILMGRNSFTRQRQLMTNKTSAIQHLQHREAARRATRTKAYWRNESKSEAAWAAGAQK